MLAFRTKQAEENTSKRTQKSFEYEASFVSQANPLKSTVEFGKYKIFPSEKAVEYGFEFKLRFTVKEIDRDFAQTDAIVEAKIIAAWLSLIFDIIYNSRLSDHITANPNRQ
jgi:hypothetical protein